MVGIINAARQPRIGETPDPLTGIVTPATQAAPGNTAMPPAATAVTPTAIPATPAVAPATPATPTATATTPTDYTSQINGLYQTHLGRAADAAGLDYWNGKLQSGETTMDQVGNYIANSNEHKIDDLYHTDLGRAPDTAGLEYWNQNMNSGQTAGAVDMYLKSSDEYKNLHPTPGQAAPPPVTAPHVVTAPPPSAASSMSGASSSTPGIVAGAMTSNPFAAISTPSSSKATSTGYTSTPWNVTPEQSVAFQLNKNLDPNSPLNVAAKTAAEQQMNARGLSNSSMAISAAQDAIIRNAMPIAQQDAATNANSSQSNAARTDTANAFTSDAGNKAALQDSQLATQASIAGAGNASSLAQAQMSAAQQKYASDTQRIMNDASLTTSEKNAQLAALTQIGVTDRNNATALTQSQISAQTQRYVADQSSQTQVAVSRMTAQSQQLISQAHDANSVLIQNNQQATQAYNSYVSAVAQIDQNDKLDSDAKVTAIARQTDIFNNAIAGIRSATPSTANITIPDHIGEHATTDTTTPTDTAATRRAAVLSAVGGVDVSGILNFDDVASPYR